MSPRATSASVRNALVRVAETAAPESARAAFNAAQLAGLREARAALGRRVADEATRGDATTVARVLARAQTTAAKTVHARLLDSVHTAARTSAETTARFIASHDPGAVFHLPSAAEVLSAANNARAAQAFAAPRHLIARWTAETQARVQDALRRGVRELASPRELLELAGEAADSQWYAIERIARTESAFAFNAAADNVIQHYARSSGRRVYKRWTERIDDATGRPLDNRVAEDSKVLHGQVALPGGAFTMPSDPRVSAKMWGRSWSFPPNRPNDRACVVAWSRGWGIPAWVLRDGRRSAMR